ncbi:hypothetical protein DFQ26_009428 [Actinomortierella ambigua]|nr:hypothetical protein DFQ26_009428 [Actinomortierella ambigua]
MLATSCCRNGKRIPIRRYRVIGVTYSGRAKQFQEHKHSQRFDALDRTEFWKLSSSNRYVEDVLFSAGNQPGGAYKWRSLALDLSCERTKALFNLQEWAEITLTVSFHLPPLPTSTARYIHALRSAAMENRHPATVPLPDGDQFSCDQALKSFIEWRPLYSSIPSPFEVNDLTESYWGRVAWPPLKSLLADVNGVTMIDGEKQGYETSRRRNHDRHADMEGGVPRKQAGDKLDTLACDTTNKRDWMIVENCREWDESSTKYLQELEVKLFKNLHLIAAHRLEELKHRPGFADDARFFSIYSGGM